MSLFPKLGKNRIPFAQGSGNEEIWQQRKRNIFSFFLSSFAKKVTLIKYFIFFLFTNFTSFREERSVLVMSDSLQGSFILCVNKQTEQNSNTPKKIHHWFSKPLESWKEKTALEGNIQEGKP